MSDEAIRRFSELVCREIEATEVVLVAESDARVEPCIRVPLSDGRSVEARFSPSVAVDQTRARRLEILVRAFESVFGDASPKRRVSVSVSLHEELRALVTRANAIDALVVDAHSPVIWASAVTGLTIDPEATTLELPPEARETLRLVRESHQGVLLALGSELPAPPSDLDSPWEPERGPEAHTPPPRPVLVEATSPPSIEEEIDLLTTPEGAAPSPNDALTTRALAEVRALPQMVSLHRGGHLLVSVREDDFGYVVRSFAGIYALVTVFDAPFDELRTERAMRDALPRIERLVLALPPLDPEPVPAGVVALRPRRRR